MNLLRKKMSEEIKTELNEDETVWPPYPKSHAQPTPKTYAFFCRIQPIFQEDDFKVTSAFDDTRQEDDTDGLEDLERVSLNKYLRTLVHTWKPPESNGFRLIARSAISCSGICSIRGVFQKCTSVPRPIISDWAYNKIIVDLGWNGKSSFSNFTKPSFIETIKCFCKKIQTNILVTFAIWWIRQWRKIEIGRKP